MYRLANKFWRVSWMFSIEMVYALSQPRAGKYLAWILNVNAYNFKWHSHIRWFCRFHLHFALTFRIVDLGRFWFSCENVSIVLIDVMTGGIGCDNVMHAKIQNMRIIMLEFLKKNLRYSEFLWTFRTCNKLSTILSRRLFGKNYRAFTSSFVKLICAHNWYGISNYTFFFSRLI